MPGKAPSEGTKVNLGKNAPVTQEGPGVVAQDSLAAESQAFRQANQAEPQPVPHEKLTSAPKPHEGGVHQSSTGSSGQPSSHAGTAPTYVLSQYLKDRGGPKGKNIKEDPNLDAEDKAKNASFSEFGTENDPGLAAEKRFTLSTTAPAGATGGRDKGIDAEQPYGPLDPNTPA
ncbi:hypothetical protein F5Y06DRAFT_305710 [Hypoxylon sp. FL0890]|nr:hypothetical protein F5Y06DRAFT_305710 [Hypoxylon sp. FL0890]